MTNLSKTHCFNENLFTYNGKTLYVESSARGYFVKKEILYSSETTLVVELFSQRRIEEPCKIDGEKPCKKMGHFATRLDNL